MYQPLVGSKKRKMETKIISIFLVSFLISLNQYAQDIDNNQPNRTNNLIDSLIQINRINDNTIMALFGSDAITAINTDKGIVLIDAGISTGLTSKFRDRIKTKFQCDNFVYVINTHAHHDHNRGNSVFNKSKIVGHENSLKEIKNQWEDPEKVKSTVGKIIKEYDLELQKYEQNSEEWDNAFKQKTRYQNSYNDIENLTPIMKPNITFSDSLNIDMRNITFELKYFGKCHSMSDILIYVPELKLLFTGDLMFQYGRPSMNNKTMSDKDLWVKAIRWLEKRMYNIDNVIGGHGQIMSIDDLKSFNKKMLEQIEVD
ncbi:MBL fold metallo-hydrolase [Mariniphaga sediminis]|uniref:MBL fold metallo-hydrolase n=2 Tax=Mariniphaga sediminis TaxID=1628158 RepID=A0A399D1D1_9BACT|nr:MBL fold metallo-hydrolase [Mariniphaga sediminis]